jgi:hypothetical protein
MDEQRERDIGLPAKDRLGEPLRQIAPGGD